jgi:hypothetical protein
MLLPVLLSIPKRSVFALINEETKTLHLAYSENTRTHLAALVNELEDGTHRSTELCSAFRAGKLELVILEDVKDPRQLRYRWNYFVDYYSNLGYNYYNNTTRNIRVKKEIDLKRSEIRVVVVNSRHDKIVLAKFKKNEDAENFISQNYGTGKVYKLVWW